MNVALAPLLTLFGSFLLSRYSRYGDYGYGGYGGLARYGGYGGYGGYGRGYGGSKLWVVAQNDDELMNLR